MMRKEEKKKKKGRSKGGIRLLCFLFLMQEVAVNDSDITLYEFLICIRNFYLYHLV